MIKDEQRQITQILFLSVFSRRHKLLNIFVTKPIFNFFREIIKI